MGYNSLLTGTWANKHNVWDNTIQHPNYSYWNIFRIVASERPESKTAIFSTWLDNRTKLVGEGLEKAGGIKMDYKFDGFEYDTINFPHDQGRKYIFNIDEYVSKEAGKHILEEGPDLSWVYLEFTDDMGHMYGDGPQLVDAVKKADQQVGRIWEAVKLRQKQFPEDWMILVTTDHGRDASGKNHGGQSDRERTIWIVSNSKNLNQSFRRTPTMVDIMPSILAHMDVTIPEALRKEADGVSFVGDIHAKNLSATRKGRQLTLKWDFYQGDGSARFFVAPTNRFKEGKEDTYVKLGKAPLSKGSFEARLPKETGSFLKILMEFGGAYLNTWLVD